MRCLLLCTIRVCFSLSQLVVRVCVPLPGVLSDSTIAMCVCSLCFQSCTCLYDTATANVVSCVFLLSYCMSAIAAKQPGWRVAGCLNVGEPLQGIPWSAESL